MAGGQCLSCPPDRALSANARRADAAGIGVHPGPGRFV